jgi:hypothetical protein
VGFLATIFHEDKELIRKNGTAGLHHTLGRHIRNTWGLWTSSELAKHMTDVYGLRHPDDISGKIISSFHKHLVETVPVEKVTE